MAQAAWQHTAAMFLIRWLIALVIFATILPLSWTILVDTWGQVRGLMPHGGAIAIGIAAGIAWIIWRKPNWLLHTLVHEGCHAIACLLLGVKIHNFQASDGKGGVVIHSRTDPIRTTIIALAPYTLPLLLGIVLLLRWAIRDPAWAPWLSGLAGFFYVDHLHGLYHNIRLNFWGKQADLSRASKPLSIAAISSALCLTTAFTLWVLYEA